MNYFRKILTVLGASTLVLLGSWGAASATTTFIVQQGGTGASTFTSSNLLYGAGTNPLGSVATTSVICTGSTTCTSFTAIGSSPITINTSGGSGTVTQINTTWPVIGGPLTTTGTLSFGGLSTSSPIAAGAAILYATGVNTLASTATSTLTGTGPISVSNAPYIIGASGAVVSCATASGSVAGCLAAADFSKFNSATTTFSTGLTYTLGTNAVTVNTSQSISTLSNLTTNGIVETSGGVGTLGVEVYPLSVLHGGTGTTTEVVSQLLYGGTGSIYQSVATSSIGVSAGLTNSGTLGAQVGGSALTLKQVENRSFSYATSTAWTATTTISLGVGYAEVWSNIKCYTDAGTLNIDFYYNSTHMTSPVDINASTTIGTFSSFSNTTPSAGSKLQVDIGTPASSPTKITCTVQNVN